MPTCTLTSSYTYAGCKGGLAGVSEFLIGPIADFTVATQTSGVWTTLTRTSGTLMRRYVLDKHKADLSYPQTYTEDSGTIHYDHLFNADIKGLSVALDAEIKLIGQNRVVIIAKDRNGVYRLAGIGTDLTTAKGLDLVTNPNTTGRGSTDVNGHTLNFKGLENSYCHSVDSSIIAALLIAAP
jgi:hypothetical protein